MMDAILTIDNLIKTYPARRGAHHALHGVSFSVNPGEVFGLLGPNGAGKSTTLNILIGLLSSDGGVIRAFGRDLATDSTWIRGQMNIATAYAQLPGRLTVEENLRIFAHLYDVPRARARIADLLERFDITVLRRRRVSALSSGQKALVNLAKALLNAPKILLLDEPTASLDPEHALAVRDMIASLQREQGMTVIWTSHNMDEIESVCDRVAFLLGGKIAHVDTPERLLKLVQTQYAIVTFPTAKDAEQCGTIVLPKTMRHIERIGTRLTIEIPHTTGAVRSLLLLLQREKLDFSDLHVESPALEDVFLQIAREQKTL